MAEQLSNADGVPGRPIRVVNWALRDRTSGNRTSGKIVVAQVPNPSLAVWLMSSLVHRAFHLPHTVATTLQVVSYGAGFYWAANELIRGVNPFRRLLGIGVIALLAASLIRR